MGLQRLGSASPGRSRPRTPGPVLGGTPGPAWEEAAALWGEVPRPRCVPAERPVVRQGVWPQAVRAPSGAWLSRPPDRMRSRQARLRSGPALGGAVGPVRRGAKRPLL